MPSIAVVDYGMGNLRSVSKALEHVAPELTVEVTDQPETIRSADKVVFPGVGAMRDCMAELQQRGLAEVVCEVATDRPFFGICLGMQLLLEQSEENGGTRGLAILPGAVQQFPDPLYDQHDREATPRERLKIPHMGWNQVEQQVDHPMWHKIENGSRFYFVHSFYAVPGRENETAATSHYGFEFASALYQKSLFATQFHPEKSQHAGLQLLKNFAQWNGQP
ncbi:MAG: imidazole glycerol phosphate synthase subunit HisH [Gammaproteobacteria bacterium]|jgi:imidazole glycerol-phosphate synthase subunit HisH|nr:imidazole glycerol phosphate synthase subunit HisH [Gammaproteobacteria bacterium]MBT7307057.1 imidazole glycerol phosphate synthase subunit HisH [Gammaproteobacteria bacterium]